MRNRRKRSGVSTGTVATLCLLVLVAGGSAFLFPKLLGRVDQRVNPRQVGVALEQSFSAFSDSVLGQPTNTPDLLATAPPTITPDPQQAATPGPVLRLSITAAGELSFDKRVQAASQTDTGYDFNSCFTHIQSALTGDIRLGTLQNIVQPGSPLTDVNMPAAAVSALSRAGFNVLSTGFYGALDGGVDGLSATLTLLRQEGILPYGTYPTRDERNRIVIKDYAGVKVAFLSFQAELSSEGKRATSKEEQAYVFAQLTLPVMTAEIAAARSVGAQVVVVSLCWGQKDEGMPTRLQQEMAQGIADAGADIILGTNPGVLQPVTILSSTKADGTKHQTLCAYSLGNLIDSDRRNRPVITSVLLHINLRYTPQIGELSFETVTYSPIYIWRGAKGRQQTFQPVLANQPPPTGMNDDQQAIMGRALTDIRALFENTIIEER